MEHEQEGQKDNELSNDPKPSIEIKKEYMEKRQEEIAQYYRELSQFCQERNIELGAELVDGDSGRRFNVFIIDKQ